MPLCDGRLAQTVELLFCMLISPERDVYETTNRRTKIHQENKRTCECSISSAANGFDTTAPPSVFSGTSAFHVKKKKDEPTARKADRPTRRLIERKAANQKKDGQKGGQKQRKTERKSLAQFTVSL